ncbi:hypothetical protein CI1B_02740 [Bradyrhizobium ivorense]|uniref:Polysaccharide chain length determinant N-terminal domain-containing protein n=2 Tax=Nitrobacteraceae TaxID=41294 RepID=A0A508SV78_9BRAD|nr:hypothetical protein CI1B_02740 [Bradyrhizobium ivorense]VIO72023.1 hypothetical protein CI41S_33900 [Bradyrhizobium ivorense]
MPRGGRPEAPPVLPCNPLIKSAMTAPTKLNREKQPDLQFDHSDYRIHYDDVGASMLRSVIRHGRLIALFVALGLMFACILIPLLPRKYSAEALIHPDLLSGEQGKVVALASVDGAALVTGEARVLRSDAILREAAKRLGEDSNAARPNSWLTRMSESVRIAWFPETRNQTPFDRAVAMLRNKLVIMNDTRSYLISISFTSSSAEEAARVVNAVVAEYLRDKVRQRRQNKVVAAEAELRQRQALFGDKHPKTLQALDDLDAQRKALAAVTNALDGDQLEVADDQSVRLAVANHTPTSPRGTVIFGLSMLFALLAGVGLAIWRDRRKFAPAAGYLPPGKETERRRTLAYQALSR